MRYAEIDADRLWSRQRETDRIGATPAGGAHRMALTPEDIKEKVRVLKRASKAEVMTCSGVTGAGVREVLFRVIATLDAGTDTGYDTAVQFGEGAPIAPAVHVARASRNSSSCVSSRMWARKLGLAAPAGIASVASVPHVTPC